MGSEEARGQKGQRRPTVARRRLWWKPACLPGHPRWAPLFGPLGQGRPARAAHGKGARHLRPGSVPPGGLRSSRCRYHRERRRRGSPRDDFGPACPAQHDGTAVPTWSCRPSAPFGWESDTGGLTSDVPCRAATPGSGFPDPRSKGTPGSPVVRSSPRQGSTPDRRFRAIRRVARDAFHRIDARHGCRTELARVCLLAPARSPNTLIARGAPSPPSRGAADPCYPACAGKMSLTDFCNRSSARAPVEPLDSLASDALRRLCAGGAPVDAVSPASVAPRTPSSRRGAPIRSGAACRSACSASRRARSTTSAAPCHPRSSLPDGAALPLAKDHFGLTLVKGRCLRSPEQLRSPGDPPGCPLAQVPVASARRSLQSPRSPSTVSGRPRFPARPAGGLPPAQRCGRPRLSAYSRPADQEQGPAVASRLASASQPIARPGASPRPCPVRAPPVAWPDSPSGWNSRARMSDPPASSLLARAAA